MPASLDRLLTRSRVIQTLRGSLLDRGFIEVETPVRIPVPALESYIDAESSGDHYLRTSPELHMKRLLAQGAGRIFQIGPCFRRGECGRMHRPEFTMLEWYRTSANYNDILKDMRELVVQCAVAVTGGTQVVWQGQAMDWGEPWEILSVQSAYRRLAGWDPVADWDADRFEMDMVERIEPGLAKTHPVVLMDYPAPAAALARLNAVDPRVAERWELYLGGLEIANAFSELVDAREQRARFEACARERASAGRAVYGMDEDFIVAMEEGLPPCAGVALGVDRLVMLLTDADSMDAVRAFA